MKVHEIIERSVEWVAYDGVLGKFDGGVAVVRTLDTKSVSRRSPGRWRWSTLNLVSTVNNDPGLMMTKGTRADAEQGLSHTLSSNTWPSWTRQ